MKIIYFISFIVVMFLIQGCSIKIPVNDIKVSEEKFIDEDNNETVVELNFVDNFIDNGKVEEGKLVNVFILQNQNQNIDPYRFFYRNLLKEIDARNLPVKVTALPENNSDELQLRLFKIHSQRTNSYTPIITIVKAKVTLKYNNKEKNIVSIIKRAKIPIFSFSEIYEDCYNEPTSIMIQEIVAKLNIELFNYKLDDETVENLMALAKGQIDNRNDNAYLTIYQLGFSNNPKAIDFIKEHTKETYPDYVRFASISTLGMLGGEKYLNSLINIYNNDEYSWEDHMFALKAIGDIGTKEAMDFLNKTYELLKKEDSDFYISAKLRTLELYIK